MAKRKISSRWLRIRERTSRGDVRIDDAVHLDPLVVQRPNPPLEALRRAILAAHPGGQLPEIILEIDSATPNGRSSSTVEKTIKVHRARVVVKMSIHSLAELVRIAEKTYLPARATGQHACGPVARTSTRHKPRTPPHAGWTKVQ